MDRNWLDLELLVKLTAGDWAAVVAGLDVLLEGMGTANTDGVRDRVEGIRDRISQQLDIQVFVASVLKGQKDGEKREVSEENYATNTNAQ